MISRSLLRTYVIASKGFTSASATNVPFSAYDFPPCSLECLSTTLSTVPTLTENFKLFCSHHDLEFSLANCVRESCTFHDQQKVGTINSNLCVDQPVQNHAYLGNIVLAILGFMTQGAIAMRIYARKTLASALGVGIDDYLIVAASLIIAYVQIAGTVVLNFCRHSSLMKSEVLALGLGKHTFNVDPSKFPANFILYWLDEICYQLVMTLIKSSILCFYLRLFALEERFRYLCYGMLVFVVANGVTFACVTIFQCRPIRGVWDKSIPSICLDNNTATFASSGVSIAIDFIILLMPIPRLLKLKVSRDKRNSVLVMFSFGLLASIVSVIRLPFIIPFAKTTDPLFDNIGPGIWTVAEMGSAVIAACLPATKSLLERWFPWLPFSSPDSRPADHSPNPKPIPDGAVSRVLNSLFSSRDNGSETLEKGEVKFYEIREGRIEPLRTRFSGLSVGFLEGVGAYDSPQLGQ